MEKKEAMKILKDFHDKSALFSVRTALDIVIPELKESEDERIERIKKAVIDFFNKGAENGEQTNGVCDKDILAWLEKQGQPKKQRCGISGFTDIVQAIRTIYNEESADELEEYLTWLVRRKEQNPVWTEEDEKRYVSCLQRLGTGKLEQPETINTIWLKSLKERVQPQPKQEWSEEIENCAREAEDNNCTILAKHIRQLKFLRPQNTWKPSDEQMKALSDINITGCISYVGQGQELINLYQDLKKLIKE